MGFYLNDKTIIIYLLTDPGVLKTFRTDFTFETLSEFFARISLIFPLYAMSFFSMKKKRLEDE